MSAHIYKQEEIRILPAELSSIDNLLGRLVHGKFHQTVGFVNSGLGQIKINLFSDSTHICKAFSINWNSYQDSHLSRVCLNIFFISERSSAEAFGLRWGRRYFSNDRTVCVICGDEYYGNLKVSIRGMCSHFADNAGQVGFVHGASLRIGNRGVVITGVSGAGKTTATKALILNSNDEVKIINDDWGWAAPGRGGILHTGESSLHMKLSSIRALRPDFNIDNAYYSELCLENSVISDERYYVRRDDIFSGISLDEASFDFFIVLTRDRNSEVSCRRIGPSDISIIEDSEYSNFYKGNEIFMDGSLLLFDNDDIFRVRRRFSYILSEVACFAVNNGGSEEDLAECILAEIR